VVLTEGILRGETQVTAGAAIAGDVLAARTGRVQGSSGVHGGFVSCLARDFHFGTPVEGANGIFWGCPPGVFSVRIGEATEKKRDGRKGVRYVRGKGSGEWREKRKAKLEKRNSKFGKSRKSERQDWKPGKGVGCFADRAEGERDQLGLGLRAWTLRKRGSG